MFLPNFFIEIYHRRRNHALYWNLAVAMLASNLDSIFPMLPNFGVNNFKLPYLIELGAYSHHEFVLRGPSNFMLFYTLTTFLTAKKLYTSKKTSYIYEKIIFRLDMPTTLAMLIAI